MNKEQLDSIRTREQAATKAPWTADNWRQFGKDGWSIRPHRKDGGMTGFQLAIVYNETVATAHEYYGGSPEGDAEFIAHARSDVPALLDEVARLRETLNWYASRGEYPNPGFAESEDAWKHRFLEDGGRRANEALKEKP